jgi:hypothetical protein
MTDFYSEATQRKLDMIDADRAEILSGLARAKAEYDTDGAAELVAGLANLDRARANLLDLHARYAQSQQPPQQPELTPEERAAKPWHRMDYSDVLEMARGSKYGQDLTWNADTWRLAVRKPYGVDLAENSPCHTEPTRKIWPRR